MMNWYYLSKTCRSYHEDSGLVYGLLCYCISHHSKNNIPHFSMKKACYVRLRDLVWTREELPSPLLCTKRLHDPLLTLIQKLSIDAGSILIDKSKANELICSVVWYPFLFYFCKKQMKVWMLVKGSVHYLIYTFFETKSKSTLASIVKVFIKQCSITVFNTCCNRIQLDKSGAQSIPS